jgi:hypothetical protein
MSDPRPVSFLGLASFDFVRSPHFWAGSESASELAREKFEFDKAKYLAGSGVSSF